MPRRASAQRRSGCPISIALELVGDRWSLLVVRDMMFKGRHSFKEFQAAGEGVASNVLSDRLARLERAGIVAQRPDTRDARRVVYRLTAKGIDLAPVMLELVLWSAKHEHTEAPVPTLREMRQRRRRFLEQIRARWKTSTRGNKRRQPPQHTTG